MTIAALDLGSNSFHLLIASETADGLVAIQRYKQKVQLGAGLDADDNLSHQAIERGLASLRTIVRLLNEHKVQGVHCVATNTLRLASNADEFIEKAEGILMSPIEVVTGQQEAQLIFKGVFHEQERMGSGMVMDIGGGSTEFAIGDINGPQTTHSLQMGCVSYSTHFFSDGKIYTENTQAALAASRICLEPELSNIKEQQIDWQLGTSGSVQSIALLCQELYQTAPGLLERALLEDLLKRLVLLGQIDAIDFASVEPGRRGILPAGLCICLSVMQQLDIEQMLVGQSSLSEGLLIRETGQSFSQLNFD